MRPAPLAALLSAGLLCACPEPESVPPPTTYTIEVDGSRATWDDAEGLLSMDDAAGNPVLRGATAFVRLDEVGANGDVVCCE